VDKSDLRLTLRELSEIKNQKALKNFVFQGFIFSINHRILDINHARRAIRRLSVLSIFLSQRCK
jgi:hypothetical protein